VIALAKTYLILLALITFLLPAKAADEPDSLQSIGSLATALNKSGDRVTLRGVVTLVRKHVAYVQDQTGAIPVSADGLNTLSIGDEVELQGEVRRDLTSVSVVHASIRKLWSGSAPVPVSLSPEQAAEGSFSHWLIDTEGRLLKKTIGQGFLRLTLEGEGQIFGATLELSSPIPGSTQLAKNVEEGSILRVVGVCAATATAEKSVGSAFSVMLRSTDDVRVISAAPWWNLEHSVWIACLVLVLISLFYRLRHRALDLRFRAIVEERSRIAREMHDTLAQGFSGLTYQLEGIAQELGAPLEKTSLERHLGVALQLVRHCREEAHRSIFALRSMTQPDVDLLELLVSSARLSHEGQGVKLTGIREGKAAPIADHALNHLLRIGQEAITNALRHSNARRIEVRLSFRRDAVMLKVSDDGDGFDVGAQQNSSIEHFGLVGMRERCKHIQAKLEITSRPGEGCTVLVIAPLVTKQSFAGRWPRVGRMFIRSGASGARATGD
jgi:signal transduction histidine kinase